jgi:hypothetical protein
MKIVKSIIAFAASIACGSTLAAGTATVQLNGGSFIQSGSVLNTSSAGVDIVKVVYDLGTAQDGIAIWENFSSTGGTQSNFLIGNWYSTETWSGLSVGTGNTFSFSGLDIDLIQSVATGSVTGSILGGPTSLANASFSVYFNDNSWGTAKLSQLNWSENQTLTITAVPEPETYAMLLAGLGFVGAIARRRKQK